MLVVCNNDVVENTNSEQLKAEEPMLIEMDYSKLEEVIPKVLQELNVEIDLAFDEDIHRLELSDFFSVEKTAFRMNVENEIANIIVHNNVEKKAEEQVERFLHTFSIAEKQYGVTVFQKEVTTFIDKHIALVRLLYYGYVMGKVDSCVKGKIS